MPPFSVWIHPLETNCDVRVEGKGNTNWLLQRLSQSFVFKTSEEVHEDPNSACCTFRVAYSSQMPRYRFEKLLAGIAEVTLKRDSR